MRATWLTWRINRFEILFVLAVAALIAVSAWVLADQIRGIGLTEALCWPRDPDTAAYATPACDRMMERFWPMEAQAGLIRVALTVTPGLLGLILGVPIVGRELELRTAGFSWSLTPNRLRWLISRFLPMLVVGVLGLVVTAWAGRTLFDALWLGRYGPDLNEVTALGAAHIARGLAAVAVALLIGALLGRTMPALLVGVVVLVGWSLFIVPRAQGVLVEQRTVWGAESWRTGDNPLTWAGDQARFDLSRPGDPGDPGLRIDEEEFYRVTEARSRSECGDPPDPTGKNEQANQEWADCNDRIYREAEAVYPSWEKVVPRSAWGDFVGLDVGMSAVLGGGALLLTFPVVARRKPE